MEEKDIIKIAIYLLLIAFWIFFLTKNKKNKKEEARRSKAIGLDYILNLKTRWYDLLFLVGIAGIINVLDLNIIVSILIVIFMVIFSKIIKTIF